jgi:hypothetical protein
MSVRALALATLLGAVQVPVNAADSGMVVLQSRAVASLPGSDATAVYLTLHNAGAQADRLLSASTPAAARAELHATMIMSGGTATMKSLPALDVPVGGTVSMAPGGMHLMLSGLKQPLRAGDRLSLTLKFAKAGSMTIAVPIAAVTAIPR